MQKIIRKIEKEDLFVLEDETIDCFLLPSNFSKEFLMSFSKASQSKGKIALLYGEDAIEKVTEMHFDGVVLDLVLSTNIKKDMQDARNKLGDNKIIGAISRARRHEAMTISENEPDFIVFKVWKDGVENMQELVSWYSDFFLIQCAVLLEEEVDVQSFSADIVISE